MKFHPVFQQHLNCSNTNDVFQYLKNNFTDSISLWNYFVDWHKVFKNFKTIEIQLNLLNYLVGKDNIEDEFRQLLSNYPKVATVIPFLIACRTANFKILTDYISEDFNYKLFSFKGKNYLTQEEINDVIEFVTETGLIELFKNKTIKSIPDYVIGVEVGLDSNGRKNRGGSTMETIVKNLLQQICQEHKLLLMPQATSPKIKQEWGINVEVDKSTRRFDFAIKNGSTLYLIETNFYGGGGSKLKSTAGEYKALFDFISSQKHKFIWITDGLGWESTLLPLEETFNHIDYILNLKMVSTGLLSEIITQKL